MNLVLSWLWVENIALALSVKSPRPRISLFIYIYHGTRVYYNIGHNVKNQILTHSPLRNAMAVNVSKVKDWTKDS